MSQNALLRPARMQLAQPAYVFAIELQSGRTARMQSRMGIGKALQATRLSAQQAFHIFLDVVEIDLAHRRTPLLFHRRPPGGPGKTLRLMYACNRQITVEDRKSTRLNSSH